MGDCPLLVELVAVAFLWIQSWTSQSSKHSVHRGLTILAPLAMSLVIRATYNYKSILEGSAAAAGLKSASTAAENCSTSQPDWSTNLGKI